VAVGAGEVVGAAADDHAVVRPLHDEPRDLRGVEDVLDAGDRPGVVGAAVHHGRVELHHAVLVRQAAQPDARVVRVRLDDLDHVDRDVEGLRALLQARVVLPHPRQRVRAAHQDRVPPTGRGGAPPGRGGRGRAGRAAREGGEAGAEAEEGAARGIGG
jgi:hypothetical protein